MAAKSKDVAVRLAATARLNDQRVLEKVATKDREPCVRLTAVAKLSSQSVILSLASRDQDSNVRGEAVRKLSDLDAVRRIARLDARPGVRMIAISRITDQVWLMYLAQQEADPTVRRLAISRITDQDILTKLGEMRPKPHEPGSVRETVPAQAAAVNGQGGAGPQLPEQAAAGLSFGKWPQTVYLANVEYGPATWTEVKIANMGAEAAPVRLEAYRPDGTALPATSEWQLSPLEEKVVRIEETRADLVGRFTAGWAKVVYPAGGIFSVEYAIEVVDKDKLRTIRNQVKNLDAPRTRWVFKAENIREQRLRIRMINIGDASGAVRTCQLDVTADRTCPASAGTVNLRGKTLLTLPALNGLTRKYLLVEATQEAHLYVGTVRTTTGDVKQFEVDSAITFEPDTR
jgi:hypothetical protein